MKTIWIDVDERYPDYSIEEIDESSDSWKWKFSAVVPDEKYEWVLHICKEYKEVQDYIESLSEKPRIEEIKCQTKIPNLSALCIETKRGKFKK